MQIYALGDYNQLVTEPLPELKDLVHTTLGTSIRRIGRFIQLALIGAGRCVGTLALPPHTGVYFSSGRGDLETTVEVMTALLRDGQTPKPLSFVHTVSNAACFYVAQHFKLQGRSHFICNRYFAFESVLQLSLLDLHRQQTDSALVGVTDSAATPLTTHRQRLQLQHHSPIGEASHWLWLGPARTDRPRLGELLTAQHFTSRQAVLTWLQQQALGARCGLSAGQFINQADFASLQKASGLEKILDYRSALGGYDSQSGAVISAFLKSDIGVEQLLHINADPDERYSVILVAR